MTAVGGFARYSAGIDPTTEIPPLGLMPHRRRWRPPVHLLLGRHRRRDGPGPLLDRVAMALKWRWRARRAAAGKATDRPNLILGANVQVVWEKFCRYWDVEARYIPIQHGRYVISPEEVVALQVRCG